MITGDLIDSKSYDAEVSMQLIQNGKKYPVYFRQETMNNGLEKYNSLEKS